MILEPTTVEPGQSATATVAFNGPLAAGVTVSISSSNTLAATIPAGQSCPAGATCCTFTVTTLTTAPVASVGITALHWYRVSPSHHRVTGWVNVPPIAG